MGIDDGMTKAERATAARAALMRRDSRAPGGLQRFQARASNLDAVRRRGRDQGEGWCILRTDGRRTLTLVRSLRDAGIDAWTPTRTSKREKPGRCEMIDGKKPTVEVDAPILPTFVFAPGVWLYPLVDIALRPFNGHPAFSVFRYGDRYPLVSAREVAGLQHAEREAMAALQAMRDAEDRAERRRLRAAEAKSERERERILRAERRYFDIGTAVTVDGMPAVAGMTGIVEASDGRSARISFGGILTMQIDAWRVVKDGVPAVPSAIE